MRSTEIVEPRSGPAWLIAAPARPASRQNGAAYSATTFVMAPIQTGVPEASVTRAGGSGGSKSICATAKAGGSATTA